MGAAQEKIKVEKSPEAYRSIGEAAKELELPTHVLRYWETKFPRLVKPLKRPDGRRLFRPQDIENLRAIQTLVHQRGMTLKGAKTLLDEQGISAVLGGTATVAKADAASQAAVHEMQDQVRRAFGGDTQPEGRKARLETVLADLVDLKQRLDAARLKSAA